MKVSIYWVTSGWNLIRRIREKYRLPLYMTLNGLAEAEDPEAKKLLTPSDHAR